MKMLVYLMFAGALGTLARYGLQGLLQPPGGTFPWGTLVVNVAGSFLLGFLVRYLLGQGGVSPETRAALTIGFCGAFTTMSSFSYETVAMLNNQQYVRAAGYLLASVGGSVGATISGLAAGRSVL
jgi:CrcB protein